MWGGDFGLNKNYDQLLSFITLKLLYQNDLYSTFQVIYVKKIIFCFQICYQPKKGFNTPTDWQINNIFSHQ